MARAWCGGGGSVGLPKLITFLCPLPSPEGRFPAGAQRCGGGCRRAGGAGVRASARTPGAHRVLETQQCANQQQGRAHRCESAWVLLQPRFRSRSSRSQTAWCRLRKSDISVWPVFIALTVRPGGKYLHQFPPIYTEDTVSIEHKM